MGRGPVSRGVDGHTSAVSHSKSESLTRALASGSFAWASNPALRKIASGLKALTAGSRQSPHARRNAKEPAFLGSAALMMLLCSCAYRGGRCFGKLWQAVDGSQSAETAILRSEQCGQRRREA